MPRKNKLNDMPAQGEVNRCDAATIVEFIEERTDDRIHGVGQLTRIAYEMLAELIVKYAGARKITDTAEATRILSKISYGKAFLNADKYASAALKNMQLDAEADMEGFDILPKQRGRKPNWTEADDARLIEAAKKAIERKLAQNGSNS